MWSEDGSSRLHGVIVALCCTFCVTTGLGCGQPATGRQAATTNAVAGVPAAPPAAQQPLPPSGAPRQQAYSNQTRQPQGGGASYVQPAQPAGAGGGYQQLQPPSVYAQPPQGPQSPDDRWDRRGAPTVPNTPDQIAVANAVAGHVQRSLKNPAEAAWGDPQITLVSDVQGVKTYMVSGYVDATNSYGAYGRLTYSGTVCAQYYARGDGTGNWEYSVSNVATNDPL